MEGWFGCAMPLSGAEGPDAGDQGPTGFAGGTERRNVPGVSTSARNPQCPLRLGDHCSLCVPGATGPADCPTVALVMSDPELRERLAELRREHLSGCASTARRPGVRLGVQGEPRCDEASSTRTVRELSERPPI